MLGIGAIIAYVDPAFQIRVNPRVLTRTAQDAEEVSCQSEASLDRNGQYEIVIAAPFRADLYAATTMARAALPSSAELGGSPEPSR